MEFHREPYHFLISFFLLEQKAFVGCWEQGTMSHGTKGVSCDGCGHRSLAINAAALQPCPCLSRVNLSGSHLCTLMERVTEQVLLHPLCDLGEVSVSCSTAALRPWVCSSLCILQTPDNLSVGIGHLKWIWACIFPQLLFVHQLSHKLCLLPYEHAKHRVRFLQSLRHLLSVDAGAVEQSKSVPGWLMARAGVTGRVGFIPSTPSYHCWSNATLTCQHWE